ncbi:NADPH-dependent FMN reductase [Streptomyces sp. NPDC057621]|uniref:NADPH-dependent FMN reductase n=1 Tax=unclassified Streptomyces TaxID=2593676 RepID=UPI0036AD165C
MNKLKLGDTRPSRNGEAVVQRVPAEAKERVDADHELIDPLDHPLPHLGEAAPANRSVHAGEHTKTTAARIEECDGYLFVTHEYHHSIPRVLRCSSPRRHTTAPLPSCSTTSSPGSTRPSTSGTKARRR